MSREVGLDQDLMVEVWRIASSIVLDRPWLLASWVDNTANIPHVVVHDGAHGAALHFDREKGPYWSGGFTRRLTWAEVGSSTEPAEWDTGWGNRDPSRKRKNRAAAYALISSLHRRWVTSKAKWEARPAPMLGDAPDSVFELAALFPSATESVQDYLRDIHQDLEEGEANGVPAYWHEPFWLVRRDGEPRLLIDEAGVAHLPITVDHQGTAIQAPPGMTLDGILKRGEVATSLAARGYSFDLREAFEDCGGPEQLAELCERGIAAVIFALVPDSIATDSSAGDSAGQDAGMAREHWGWDYGDGDYVLSWLSRAKDADTLKEWHRREQTRRHQINTLRDPDDPTPLLVLESMVDGRTDPTDHTLGRLRSAIIWHLQFNLLPAVPRSMVDTCLAAVRLAEAGQRDSLVALPTGVTFADEDGAPVASQVAAREVIRQHSLSNFIQDPGDHIERRWDLEDALEALNAADRGEWEIPSPAPSWPEYVTLLLVGRNHLVAGVEDDPGERAQLREWWIDDKNGWDWKHSESWWSKQDRVAMNLPGQDVSPRAPQSGGSVVDESLLDQKEKAEAGGFHLVASATFSHLMKILDRAVQDGDPSAILELYSAGGIAWKYAGHPSLDELPVDVQRQAARSWRETRGLLFTDSKWMQEAKRIDDQPLEQSTVRLATLPAAAPRTTSNTHLDEHGRLVSADRVTAIDTDEVFVFGANGRGKHGSGSARAAFDSFGAAWGVADGATGQSYAIDTMSGEATMDAAIERFLGYAAAHPRSVFLVTAIGTGIAGYTHAQVAKHFAGAGANVALPREFWEALPVVPAAAAAPMPTAAPPPAAASAAAVFAQPARPLGPAVGRKTHGKQSPTKIPPQWLDRAAGAMVGMAIGDALGSQYEFGPPHPDDFVPEFGIGVFGHGIGEWTDDTSMALPILESIARGDSLRDEAVLGWIVGEWDEWAKSAKDVGAQTQQVLQRLGGVHTEQAARIAAKANHESTGRSAGNGSLMRTAPVALAYLEDGREKRLVEAASRVAQLTHWEASNVEACALWCLFIRQAIRTGDFNPWEQRNFIVDPDRGVDGAALIDQGLHGHPRDYREKNGWVVKAFQAAHVAVRGASSFREAIHRAIQGGGDTDTVAAITGSLAGAKWGVSGIPLSWQRKVHGWPGYDANDLSRLAILAVRRGESDAQGWPAGDSVLNPHFRHTAPVRHPHDDGVWLGSQSALPMLPNTVSAVVSLGRLGTKEVPAGIESIRVWLIDKPDLNLNLDVTLADAADLIAKLRDEGKEVFVHCAEARSRTSAVAALYAVRHVAVPLDEAWRALDGRRGGVLPYYDPAHFLQEAVARIVAQGRE